MSRAAFWGAFVAALALALAFRLADPFARPMHHDEANQAVRFGLLLETGEYHYDQRDHHGPTLYYLTLPFAWARGQRTLSELDERTMRMVPAVFGTGLILLFLLLSRGIGRPAVATAAALAAVSPVLTYYGRFYIQESLFAFFVLAFLIALGRYALRPGAAPAVWAGGLAGLAYATKETWLVVMVPALAACALAAIATREAGDRPRVGPRARALHGLAAIGAALVPALLLYSSFLQNPAGLVDSVSAFSIYFERGLDPGGHGEPWYSYLRTLAWSSSGGLVFTDVVVLVLAGAGIAHAVRLRRTAFWPLFLCLYSLGTTALFSAIPYKTPWNLLPFYMGFVLMAGVGAAALVERARPRPVRVALVVVLVAAGWQLAMQSRRASFQYPTDPRNPYAYVHTSPDFVRLASRVHDLAARHPDGRGMLVKVVAGPYEQWPFPWYARDLARVGYWSRAAEAGALDGVPVILTSEENVAAVEAAVGDRYVSEFYGLRPGVLLTLYVERGLWERFVASRR
jgi:uncharacterized protein (TIGR03663 family)